MRTIPTHVGRTLILAGAVGGLADHPHARGENGVGTGVLGLRPGPSPRTWGERYSPQADFHQTRTIPTHVGRTNHQGKVYASTADHPHARGENDVLTQMIVQQLGPSPRTWGEPKGNPSRRWAERTIPTHVGRTPVTITPGPQMTDHPHARGENTSAAYDTSGTDGPSPRTWGEPCRSSPAATSRRTIPTHVGRTGQGRSDGESPTDHPHARGENEPSKATELVLTGPSPRTWGELPAWPVRGERIRTIPTHVGRTRFPQTRS